MLVDNLPDGVCRGQTGGGDEVAHVRVGVEGDVVEAVPAVKPTLAAVLVVGEDEAVAGAHVQGHLAKW